MSEVTVKCTKTLRNGNQLAEVLVPKRIGMQIIQKDRVKLGWVLCRAKEKVSNTRCYKCLEYGRFSAQCTSKEDRSKNCLNCGKLGHMVRECNEAPFFIICKREGRTGHFKCPGKKSGVGLKDAGSYVKRD